MDYGDDRDELIARIKARVADPLRASEAAAWVRPIHPVPPPVSLADVEAAEAALGFPLPSLLRRLYTEVGNGGWGPANGLGGIPTDGAEPDPNDIVGMYRMMIAPERALETPNVDWPHGLAQIIDRGCVSFEVMDFLQPPHPFYLLDDSWDVERPVRQCLIPVASSLEERLEQWLASSAGDADCRYYRTE